MKIQLPKSKIAALSAVALSALGLNAQIAFTNSSNLLHSNTGVVGSNGNASGNSVTVVDMNGDGLDDICKLTSAGEIRLEIQKPGGTFNYIYCGTMAASGAWAMCAGDVDKNGWKDVITGYGSSLKLMKIGPAGSMGVSTLMNSNFFVQNMNFMDIDGDTWLDIFACDDNAHAKIYRNDGTGNLYILGHSTNSLTIGTGSKSLTVQTNLGFTAGQNIKVGYDGQNYMSGTVTSYNAGTGALVVNITSVVGTGTFATWCVDKSIVLNTQLSTLSVGTDPYDSGNYGTVWTDFDDDGDVDLYIAKCRQAASSATDPRRRDVLFENLGNGNFKDRGANYSFDSMDQDWTSSFGDINNDGDFDLFLTKHNTSPRIYLNNNGVFTPDATVTFGNMPMQSQFEDLDNDGFVDIIITGDNDHRIYRNNGNGTFSDVTPANLTVGKNALSFASGDLNHDGKIDLYFSYGSTYNNSGSQTDIFWQNSTNNSNHFITIIPAATNSNLDALGVKVKIYGPWGIQTREVRAGESYGTLNSGHCHFGLGSSTTIDSVVVHWPSGVNTVVVNPQADQFLSVGESGQCTLSGIVITPSGSTNICSGQTVTLSAPSGTGYTYLWSTGATTSSITVSTAGSYAVQVSQSAGCVATSPAITVSNGANETPTVAASQSNLTFCQGENVTLTSSNASSYQWYLNGNAIAGATAQSIVPTQSGSYAVQIQGSCQTWTSTATSVTVNPAPATPTGADVYITAPQSVTLNATGTNDVWFDAPVGGNQLATGNNYVTPVVTVDTTFYVEDQMSYGGANVYGGMKFHSGTGNTANFSGGTTNASLIFDVLAPCTLNTVKVYADQPGNRLIELRNSAGTVINSLMVNIPVTTTGTIDSTVVTLNFPLTVGTGYQLGTNTAQNQTLLGTASPRLRRSNANVTYPYAISNLVNITNSTQGSTVYYYFYDWNVVDAPMVCPSPRHPQSVLFNTLGVNNANNDVFEMFPNPASTSVSIRMKSACETATALVLTDVTGKVVYSASVSAVKKGELVGVDLNQVAKGIYFLNVIQAGKKTTMKLIIE